MMMIKGFITIVEHEFDSFQVQFHKTFFENHIHLYLRLFSLNSNSEIAPLSPFY